MENNEQLKSFKDLKVWQKAADLASLIYVVTEKFPRSELYGLTNQMRRSAISISSNIAEGFKRNHKNEKLQFYNVAYGSVAELESQTEIAIKLNFISNDDYRNLSALTIEISKMIDGLIKSVKNLPKSYPKSHILNSIFFLIALCSLFYILNPLHTFAAELFFDAKIKEIAVGQQFQVDLILDTGNEEINAVEGKVSLPADLLELKEIRDGSSIINFWIERPSLNSKSYILYSGITPGGFNDDNGLIFSMIFEAKKEGSGTVEIQDDKTLLNDGQGTQAAVRVKNLEFRIQDLGAKEPLNSKSYILYPEDKEPPESFPPEIASDPNIFDGKWFLVFATQDKGFGIDRYEVLERREFRIQDLGSGNPMSYILNSIFSRSIVTESPYLLKDQNLRSYIYVKAIDKAGNERIAVVEPRHPLKWYEYPEFLVIIIIILVIISIYSIKRILWEKSLTKK